MPPIIHVDHLAYAYGGLPVLTDVSFDIRAGEYIGIVGQNGGGKTTLLKLLLGLISPQAGTIEMFGTPIADFRERHFLGYVPQRVAMADFPATVAEVVASGRSAACVSDHLCAADAATDVRTALVETGMLDLADRPLGELSGGQRQRVFIARALAGHPRVLILDEPTTGIDPASQQQFYELLRHLNHSHGLTILFVSHDIGVITSYATRVFALNQTVTIYDDPHALTEETIHGGHVCTHHHH